MWAALPATRSKLNLSGIATEQASSQSPQPVHAAGSTNVGFFVSVAVKDPSARGSILSTSL